MPFDYFENLFPLTCPHLGAMLATAKKFQSDSRHPEEYVLFAFFNIGFAHTFEQIVYIRVKGRDNTNLLVLRHIKSPLPVDVRCSKTPLLQGDVTPNDSERRFLAQQSVAILEQCCNHSKQCRNNVATLRCTKNRRCESLRVTSP